MDRGTKGVQSGCSRPGPGGLDLPAVTPSSPRILAVRFSSIGDIILATPLLRAIRARHPDAYLAVATKRMYLPLLADNPRVDRVFALEPGSSLAGLASQLRHEHFTHLLDLHGSLRSRILRILVPGPWQSYPKRRRDRRRLIRTKQDTYLDRRHVAERYFDAAGGLEVEPDGGPAEFFVPTESAARAAAWLEEHGLAQERPLVALVPGAAHPTKEWPAEYWRTLAAQLTGGDRPVDLVVVGGRREAAIAESIVTAAGRFAAASAGLFDLAGTGALLARAGAVLAGDTGPMHLATAVGAPVVALYGPTVGAFGFTPYRAPGEVLQVPLSCRPCSAHGGPACPLGHHRCLRDIAPAQVAAALRRFVA